MFVGLVFLCLIMDIFLLTAPARIEYKPPVTNSLGGRHYRKKQSATNTTQNANHLRAPLM